MIRKHEMDISKNLRLFINDYPLVYFGITSICGYLFSRTQMLGQPDEFFGEEINLSCKCRINQVAFGIKLFFYLPYHQHLRTGNTE